MRLLIATAAFLALAGCVTPDETAHHGDVARGQAIAESNCATCHATGRAGESPLPRAPLFRRLSHNYPLASLEEALAEGISVGHPAMPPFAFPPQDIDALIAYLQSIQEEPQD